MVGKCSFKKKKLSPLQLRTFSSRNSKKKTDALTQNNPPKMAKRKKKRKSNQVPVKSKTIKSIFPWELLIANPFEKTMVVFIRKKKHSNKHPSFLTSLIKLFSPKKKKVPWKNNNIVPSLVVSTWIPPKNPSCFQLPYKEMLRKIPMELSRFSDNIPLNPPLAEVVELPAPNLTGRKKWEVPAPKVETTWASGRPAGSIWVFYENGGFYPQIIPF